MYVSCIHIVASVCVCVDACLMCMDACCHLSTFNNRNEMALKGQCFHEGYLGSLNHKGLHKVVAQ